MIDVAEIYAPLVARGYADRLFTDLPEQRRDGRKNMKARCPFCNGNDFAYSLEEPVYHCWNCDQGGDWLTYLQKREGLGFKEALQRLAREAGVTLNGFDQSAYAQSQRKADLLRVAQNSFRHNLYQVEGAPTLEYLRTRGYTESDIREMELGAYVDRNKLVQQLNREGFSQKEIDASGLLTRGFGETHTLAMLWTNAAGRPIGLACRSLLSNEERKERKIDDKYKYSYGLKKGQGLIGLMQAAQMVRAAKPMGALVLVEGLLDALYLLVKGVPAVALGGISLSPEQVKALEATGIEQIILMLDNDASGRRGTDKAIQQLRISQLQIFVAQLPETIKDPDQLVRTCGVDGLVQVCSTVDDWARWKARAIIAPFDFTTDRGRDMMLDRALAYYSTITDGIYRRSFREELLRATLLTAAELDNRAEVYAVRAAEQHTSALLQGLERSLHNAIAAGDTRGAEVVLRQGLEQLRHSHGPAALEPYVLDDLIVDLQSTTEGLSTGWQSLDRLIRIPSGALTLIAGRPGHGKTTMLLNLLLNVVERYPDRTFSFYSYEEARAMLGLKIIMRLAGKILHQEFNQEAYLGYLKGRQTYDTAIERAKEQFEEYTQSGRLWLQDRRLSAEDLIASIGRQRNKIGAVFVDYIQKVPLARSFSQRYLEVKEASALLLEQAVQTNIPIILGAQLGRAQGTGQKVRLDNLREAGDLEQDAALVLGLYNASVERIEDQGRDDPSPVVDLELSILKHRSGMAGRKTLLDFERASLRVRDRINSLY